MTLGYLGPYQIVAQLGQGGMGQVLRGRAPDGREVAIKVLLARATSKEAFDRFDRERRLQAELGEAAGFVPLLDAGLSPQGPYLVMPLVPGGTLRKRLDAGLMPVDDAIALVRGLAQAMGRAHERGIVHRDLKPDNVLFTADGRPLIADLGLGKHFRHDTAEAAQSVALSKSGEFKGTVGYMAPEQTGRSRDAGPPADVFALGVILYECLGGARPFDGDSAHEILAKVSSGSFPSLRGLRPEAPRWITRVIARALRREPEERWRDANELVRAIDEGPRVERRRRLVTIAATLGGVAVTAAALHLGLKSSGTSGASPVATAPPPVQAPPPPRPKGPGPDWYRSLAPTDRPAYPLPKGIEFGEAPGEYLSTKDGSVLVFVPAGAFLMGAEGLQWATPIHKVRLGAYFVGKYEVTNEQFAAFVRATGHVTRAEKPGEGGSFGVGTMAEERPLVVDATWRTPQRPGVAAEPRHPVVQLTWEDATAYCKWAGLRLPTEAEWERAAAWDASADRARRYPWGDDPPSATSGPRGNVPDEALRRVWGNDPTITKSLFDGYDDGFVLTAPVGSFPAGASAVGAQDLAGNVSEWCEDDCLPDFYSRTTETTDPIGRGKPHEFVEKSIRGGSFCNRSIHTRSATRWSNDVNWRANDLGFRVARGAR